MQSIKISTHVKQRIEKKQAELLLESNVKITQAELLERIVEKAIDNPEFMGELFLDGARVVEPLRKPVTATIHNRIKAEPCFFKDEWED